MSKITMPAPAAKVHVGNPVRYEHIDAWSLNVGTHDLITTTQAEAYANSILAPTSKALEVVQVALERICAIDRYGECESIAMDALSDIRALIPKDEA